MNTLTLPGFTAEASLYRSDSHYQRANAPDALVGVIPGWFRWTKRLGLKGEVAERLFPEETGNLDFPTASCDLTCGSTHYDCSRAGGKQKECDAAYDGCIWGCQIGPSPFPAPPSPFPL